MIADGIEAQIIKCPIDREIVFCVFESVTHHSLPPTENLTEDGRSAREERSSFIRSLRMTSTLARTLVHIAATVVFIISASIIIIIIITISGAFRAHTLLWQL